MAAATATRIALQLVALPLVARIIGPDAYGIVALATPLVLFLLVFDDLGLGASLVRIENPSRDLESSVFWAANAVGLCLALLMLALARPLGGLLGQPDLPPILFGLCPMFLLSSLAIVPLSRIQREGRFKTAALGDLVSGVGGTIAALFGALSGWGAWSLVAQQLVLWSVRLIYAQRMAGFVPRLVFRWDLIRESLGFGAGLAGSSVLTFLVTSVDKVIVGGALGTAALGFYTLAWQIVSIPVMVLASAHYSLFPAISEAHRTDGRTRRLYLEAVRVVLLIAAPLMTGLALTGDMAASLLLGEVWAPTAPLMVLMAPAGLLLSLYGVNSALLLGVGRSDIEFQVCLARLVVTLATVQAAVLLGGARAAAIAISCSAALVTAFYLRAVLRVAGVSWSDFARMGAAPAAASGALALAVLTFRGLLAEDLSLLLRLALCMAVGGFVYLGALFVGYRERFSADLVMIMQLLSKRQA